VVGFPARERRRPLVDPFAEKIDELVDRSRAQIRADKARGVLVAMGYQGSYRTTRRAVAEAKQRWRQTEREADAAVDPAAGVVVAVGLRRRA
jgi:hypothetical protein